MLAAMATTEQEANPGDRVLAADATRAVRRVLLATDLSSASAHAEADAVRLAVEHAAELVVLSVIDPNRLRLPGGRFLRRMDEERARVEAQIRRIAATAREAGARATFLVWEGDPAESILAVADSEVIDVVVMGSHGRGPLGRLVLGSISARVTAAASCEVVVVPG
jgi:nucleotide-binding universal stress UspA family protein